MIQSLLPLLVLLLPHGDAAPREVANPEDNELDSGPRKPGRYDWKEKYANYDKEQHEKLMKKYASLPYTVTKELKEGLEERQYPIASWVCKQIVPDGTEEQNVRMFWPLFNYIQGNNAENKTIAMTTPVPIQLMPTGNLEMCFWLGKPATHPEPREEGVYLKETQPLKIVTRKVGGFMDNRPLSLSFPRMLRSLTWVSQEQMTVLTSVSKRA